MSQEREINMATPLVSICCNTFNHERYIRDALEGFVSQKTDFDIEILVYDDASTDATADIIREYEAKYPHLLKPIYQTVNQYSQGLAPGHQNRARATGKYIAMCEGDDYWIDPLKLQKQVDYMEAHPDCTFCFTNGYRAYDRRQTEERIVPWDKHAVTQESPDFDVPAIEMLGYIPTASFLFPRATVLPTVPAGAFRGDHFAKLSRTNAGYAHFIDEPTVVYRLDVPGSATASWKSNNTRFEKQSRAFMLMYEAAKEFTGHRWDDLFDMRICQYEISLYNRLGDYAKLKQIAKSPAYKLMKLANRHSRFFFYMQCKHPRIIRLVRKLRGH